MSKGYFCLPMRDTLHSFQPRLFSAEIAFANSSSWNTASVLFKEIWPSPSPGDGHLARGEVKEPNPPALSTSRSCSPASWPADPGWVAEMPSVHSLCGSPGQRGWGRPAWGCRVSSQLGYSSVLGLSITRLGSTPAGLCMLLVFSYQALCPAAQAGTTTQSFRWVRDGHTHF